MSMNSKSKLADFRASVTISAPIGEVWKKLVDWKSQGQWMALTKVNSSADKDGSSGIGTTISAFTGIGKIGIWDEMKITAWSPETFCAVDHYGRWIKGIGEIHSKQDSWFYQGQNRSWSIDTFIPIKSSFTWRYLY